MSKIVGSVIKVLIGTVLFVGLPLVGWGVTDFKGFLSHPARFGYVVLTILLQIVGVIMVPGIRRDTREGRQTVRRQRIAVLLLQVLCLVIVLAAPYSDRSGIAAFGELTTARYLGLALFALGLVMVSWAEASLGRLFSVQVTLQDGHRLVTDGLYRYLRHPRYSGVILYNIGIALVYRSWLALVLVAAVVLVLLWRIHDEEHMMHEAFGTEWETYTKRSWRLVPLVY